MSEEQKLPTGAEVEEIMIKKELENQKKAPDPLDTHAQLFFMFNPRFQSTIQFMSKKQLIRLISTLVGSVYNKDESINHLVNTSRKINKKGLIRIVGAVIEHPLANEQVRLMSKDEQTAFHLFDEMLINKYFNCLKTAQEKMEAKELEVTQLEDVIIHNYNLKEFNNREYIEKDAFALASKLLASKFLMMLVTYLQTAKEFDKAIEETKKEEIENGTKT